MSLTYYAQKDALGFPIPGTMMGAQEVPPSSISIPAEDVIAGGGYQVVEHPEKLRYFVRKDKNGDIIPNSLIISLDKPQGLVYEFKLLKHV